MLFDLSRDCVRLFDADAFGQPDFHRKLVSQVLGKEFGLDGQVHGQHQENDTTMPTVTNLASIAARTVRRNVRSRKSPLPCCLLPEVDLRRVTSRRQLRHQPW